MYIQIFLYFDKHRSVSEFIKYGSRVINKLFNKTMQKLSAELSKAGPKRSPRSPPLISTPDYMYRMFSVQEVALLLNLPEAIKRKFSVQGFYVRPGVSKLRPAGQIRPAKPFHPAREAVLSMMKK